jgi:hypothetical protein
MCSRRVAPRRSRPWPDRCGRGRPAPRGGTTAFGGKILGPCLQFSFVGGKPGDRVAVTWVDNRGETRTDEAVVA